MHLEELDIHNFRGFKDYTLKLNPFNVLIGENNSGKTSVLQAIQLVYESIQVLFGRGEYPRFTDINPSVLLQPRNIPLISSPLLPLKPLISHFHTHFPNRRG